MGAILGILIIIILILFAVALFIQLVVVPIASPFIQAKARKTIENKRNAIISAMKKIGDTNKMKNIISAKAQIGIIISENNEMLYIIKEDDSGIKQYDYTYNDILEVEVLEDGCQVTKTSRTSQLGGALLGGLLLGGTGAVIGGLSGNKVTTNMVQKGELKIIVNDKNNPFYILTFFICEKPIEKSKVIESIPYKDLLYWHGLISLLIRNADAKDKASISNDDRQNNKSIADELNKLKKLLDEGIITEAEFKKLKEKLL